MNHQSPYMEHYSPSCESTERRHLEMKRRLGVLRYRQDRLTNELKAIDSALISLNQQIRTDIGYKQLSL